jgi:excisionase family DNA binding protein
MKILNEVPIMADTVYTVSEAATLLKVSIATIRRMIDDGQLRAIKVRGQLRIPKEEIDRILRGN